LPAGLLIAAVLVLNEVPDVEADSRVGKRNLVVRLGTRRAVWLYVALVVGAYGAVAVGVAVGWMPWPALAVGLVAPLTWRAMRRVRAHHAEPPALVPAQAATIGQHFLFLALLAASYLVGLALR
jgi:1,4-dihydroxy-2-naphthoate octaprenyltransferase